MTQITRFNCPIFIKRFQSLVFPFINVIKVISSHIRCPEPSMGWIWAEFRLKSKEKGKIDNIDPNNAFSVYKLRKTVPIHVISHYNCYQGHYHVAFGAQSLQWAESRTEIQEKGKIDPDNAFKCPSPLKHFHSMILQVMAVVKPISSHSRWQFQWGWISDLHSNLGT